MIERILNLKVIYIEITFFPIILIRVFHLVAVHCLCI